MSLEFPQVRRGFLRSISAALAGAVASGRPGSDARPAPAPAEIPPPPVPAKVTPDFYDGPNREFGDRIAQEVFDSIHRHRVEGSPILPGDPLHGLPDCPDVYYAQSVFYDAMSHLKHWDAQCVSMESRIIDRESWVGYRVDLHLIDGSGTAFVKTLRYRIA